MQAEADISKQGIRGMWISIAAYIVLSVIKSLTGYYFHSEALLADGLNNATDVAASLAVLIGLKISQKPPDRDHPYGHSRAETISAMIASFIMFVVGFQVLVESVKTISGPAKEQAPQAITGWIAGLGIIVMLAVYWYNKRLAARINSQAVYAAAQDNRSDALVSLGALIGIVGTKLGLPWLDPLAAAIVGVIIGYTAWTIFRDAAHSLSDGFDESRLKPMRQTVQATPGVRSIRDIRARVHGNHVLVDMTVCVDPMLNVEASHDIAENIEQRMRTEHSVSHVHVHIEPETESLRK